MARRCGDCAPGARIGRRPSDHCPRSGHLPALPPSSLTPRCGPDLPTLLPCRTWRTSHSHRTIGGTSSWKMARAVVLLTPISSPRPWWSVSGGRGRQGGLGRWCRAGSQGLFPTQDLNKGLLHCRQSLYHLSHQGSPKLPRPWNRSTGKEKPE